VEGRIKNSTWYISFAIFCMTIWLKPFIFIHVHYFLKYFMDVQKHIFCWKGKKSLY
jgi:hypothetical protein